MKEAQGRWRGMWRSAVWGLLLSAGMAQLACSGKSDEDTVTSTVETPDPGASRPVEQPAPQPLAVTPEAPLPALPAPTAATPEETTGANTSSMASTGVDCPTGATSAEACEVSREIYLGWRSFHTHCFQCHGGSAMGSTFAPNLMERLATRVDHARFLEVMQKGYVGQMGVMPSFAKNSAVQKDKEAVYAYLLARKQGLLPAGRPQRLP